MERKLPMIRVLIVDDHAIVRKGLVQILKGFPERTVIAEADCAEEALAKISETHFDVVLLDISLPGKNGLEVLKEMKLHKPELPVLILSICPEEQFAVKALCAGASGYLGKESSAEKLLGAMQKVLQGGKYISDSLAEKLVQDLIKGRISLGKEKVPSGESIRKPETRH